jgi:hypothetical protein
VAFVRWNQNTNIWEVAVTPENPATLFNHLPIANPTLPLDTANKQYVDSLVGGGPFVPYVGATANVQLGGFSVYATAPRFTSLANANIPTAGSFVGSSLTVLATAYQNYGLNVGVSNSGDVWMQAQRFDANPQVYNLILQPLAFGAYGKVGIRVADATSVYLRALLTIGAGGDTWTTQGWNRAIQIPDVSTIRWNNSGSLGWGIGTSANNFYFITSTADDNGASAVYPFFIQSSGNLYFTGSPFERGRALSMGDYTTYTPVLKSYGGADAVIGNGTLYGYYCLVGRTCYYIIRFVAGSTTVFPASYWAFTLPIGATTTDISAYGHLRRSDGATFRLTGVPAAYYSGIYSSVAMLCDPSGGFVIGNYNPIAFGPGDAIWLSGHYFID